MLNAGNAAASAMEAVVKRLRDQLFQKDCEITKLQNTIAEQEGQIKSLSFTIRQEREDLDAKVEMKVAKAYKEGCSDTKKTFESAFNMARGLFGPSTSYPSPAPIGGSFGGSPAFSQSSH